MELNNRIQCPILPQSPRQPDTTVYWSVLSNDGHRSDIILAKFPDGETPAIAKYDSRYSLAESNSISVSAFAKREERYCCHVFEHESDLRTACINVTWLGKPNSLTIHFELSDLYRTK